MNVKEFDVNLKIQCFEKNNKHTNMLATGKEGTISLAQVDCVDVFLIIQHDFV